MATATKKTATKAVTSFTCKVDHIFTSKGRANKGDTVEGLTAEEVKILNKLQAAR